MRRRRPSPRRPRDLRAPDRPVTENESLAEACKRAPRGVVCLLSALRFQGLTTQAPFEVWLAEAMPIPVEFVNPQKKKVAHAEPFALAVRHDRVRWNPEVFEKYPDLKDNFDLFPTRGVPDDDVDAIAGAFLMGERERRSLAGHLRQALGGATGVAGASDAEIARRVARPGTYGAGVAARIVTPDMGRNCAARAVPRRGW